MHLGLLATGRRVAPVGLGGVEAEVRLSGWVAYRCHGEWVRTDVEVREDFSHRQRIGDGREHAHLLVAAGTAEGIEAECSPNQHGPVDARFGGEEVAIEQAAPALAG